MLIRRMTATFGALADSSLELKEGLNILEAPNEAGKSTWCAFLLAMLYGVDSREPDGAGYIADKNRYAPWSGAPMSGSMDCFALGRELTITRATARAASPMGAFRAVYAGTDEPVPGLSDRICGETLLGVTREVYERSAFIRQAGLPISQDAGLERRIAALISSGEEDVSYMEASDSLKQALNRRRYHQTGQIPALERELSDTRRQIDGAEDLASRLDAARERTADLERREAALREELDAVARWEADESRRIAGEAAERAEARAAELRQALEADGVPETETIARLRAAVVNQMMARTSAKQAQTDRDEAAWAMETAEAAMRRSPFAGKSAMEAEDTPVDLPPRPRFPRWLLLAMVLAAAAAGNLAAFLAQAVTKRPAPSAGVAAGGIVLLILAAAARWVIHQRQLSWEAMAAKRRAKWDKEKEKYLSLLRAALEAQKRAGEAQGTVDSYDVTERSLLREIRTFAPGTVSLGEADERLRECARRRKELNAAVSAAREAAIRRDVLNEQAVPGADGDSPPVPPARDRETVSMELGGVRGELAAARSDADQLAGQLQASGDLSVLRSSAARTKDEIGQLEEEFEALQLAMVSMSHANAVLQSRFSPALAKRAGEIFHTLTEGRYEGIALDRSFNFSAETDGVFRSSALLSSGCADQLYLAARLAICEMALPAEQAAPIVLDDALANFDDKRCRAALRFLKKEAEKRQILLFTCHSREASILSRDKKVSIQRLTRQDA